MSFSDTWIAHVMWFQWVILIGSVIIAKKFKFAMQNEKFHAAGLKDKERFMLNKINPWGKGCVFAALYTHIYTAAFVLCILCICIFAYGGRNADYNNCFDLKDGSLNPLAPKSDGWRTKMKMLTVWTCMPACFIFGIQHGSRRGMLRLRQHGRQAGSVPIIFICIFNQGIFISACFTWLDQYKKYCEPKEDLKICAFFIWCIICWILWNMCLRLICAIAAGFKAERFYEIYCAYTGEMDTLEDDEELHKKIATEEKSGLVLTRIDWLQKSENRQLVPEDYFKAAGEGLMIVAVITGIITKALKPEFLTDNPLIKRLAYNNICVFWDAPPALYIGTLGIVLITYFNIRYALLDLTRIQMLKADPSTIRLTIWVNYLFIFSTAMMPFWTVITPANADPNVPNDERDIVWAHTGIFWIYILIRGVVVIKNYVVYKRLRPDRKPDTKAKIWFVLYLFDSLALVFITMANYIHFDFGPGKDDLTTLTPRWLNQTTDHLFFVLLALQNACMPSLGYGVKQKVSVFSYSAIKQTEMTGLSKGVRNPQGVKTVEDAGNSSTVL